MEMCFGARVECIFRMMKSVLGGWLMEEVYMVNYLWLVQARVAGQERTLYRPSGSVHKYCGLGSSHMVHPSAFVSHTYWVWLMDVY